VLAGPHLVAHGPRVPPGGAGTRFLLEYGKAEEALRAWGIRSTIVVFGSARVRADGPAPQSSWYREAELSGGSSPSEAVRSVWTEAFVTTLSRLAAAPG
jgi:hypothetical protein